MTEGGRTRRRGQGKKTLNCHVCGDKAPSHIHYGGIACFSCRAFFRRSVGKSHTYSCTSGCDGSDEACVMTPQNRKFCQACR